MNKVRKAIIPAAGYGTRFLPATKALPKEMLPIVDKPIIQFVVEDVVSAGIKDIIIVTGAAKRAIEDHFDYPFELESRLEEAGKNEELKSIRAVADMADFYFLRQRGLRGNGTPLLNAKDLVGDEPFLMLAGDEFFETPEGAATRAQQLLAAYEKYNAPVITTIKRNSPEDYKRYGYVEGEQVEPGLIKISRIVEKPGVGNTKSEQISVLGGVFTPDIFAALEQEKKKFIANGAKGEFVAWDGLNALMQQGKPVYALEIKDGKYHDCGNKLEYIKANVEFALKHQDLKEEFSQYLKGLEF